MYALKSYNTLKFRNFSWFFCAFVKDKKTPLYTSVRFDSKICTKLNLIFENLYNTLAWRSSAKNVCLWKRLSQPVLLLSKQTKSSHWHRILGEYFVCNSLQDNSNNNKWKQKRNEIKRQCHWMQNITNKTLKIP